MPAQAYKIRKAAPRPQQREPILERPARRFREVTLVTVFNQTDLQKDYDGFTMVYDGRAVRKLVPGYRGTLLPTRKEMMAFLTDISEAAGKDPKIKEYVGRNPYPARIWVQG